jgi:hypothetical protein
MGTLPTNGAEAVKPFAVHSNGTLTALAPVSDGQPAHSGQVGISTLDFM